MLFYDEDTKMVFAALKVRLLSDCMHSLKLALISYRFHYGGEKFMCRGLGFQHSLSCRVVEFPHSHV